MTTPHTGPDEDAGAAAPSPAGPARRPSTGRKRISYQLAAVSSAAILAVYAAGYARTATAERQLTAPPPVVATQPPRDALVAPPTATAAPAAPTAPSQPAPAQAAAPPASAPPAPAPTNTPAAAGASGLRDGTYTGMGTSRHGDIAVTLTIKGGRIVSAEVTQCSTRYPCSLVNPLVSEIVSKQAAPVDFISGATDSSEAFQGAVTDALAQAQQ